MSYVQHSVLSSLRYTSPRQVSLPRSWDLQNIQIWLEEQAHLVNKKEVSLDVNLFQQGFDRSVHLPHLYLTA